MITEMWYKSRRKRALFRIVAGAVQRLVTMRKSSEASNHPVVTARERKVARQILRKVRQADALVCDVFAMH